MAVQLINVNCRMRIRCLKRNLVEWSKKTVISSLLHSQVPVVFPYADLLVSKNPYQSLNQIRPLQPYRAFHFRIFFLSIPSTSYLQLSKKATHHRGALVIYTINHNFFIASKLPPPLARQSGGYCIYVSHNLNIRAS